MSSSLNDITVGQLMLFFGGMVSFYFFIKYLIAPIVNKWLKIDKSAIELSALKTLPDRVEKLETRSERDFHRLNSIDDVNVLMIEALQALIRNRRTNNDVANLKVIEDKIDGFLVGKVRS